jgi:hypothetical protein
MLKIVLSLIVFSSFSFAITKNQIYILYKSKNYYTVCNRGKLIFDKFRKDEITLSIIALSCIKKDQINIALRISTLMNKTKIGRTNASYVANLHLIKRLLIQFVYDKIDLSNLSLPKSNHFLSIVFENLSKHNYTKQNNSFVIHTKNTTYILKSLQNKNNNKIVINIIKNNHIYKHIFW